MTQEWDEVEAALTHPALVSQELTFEQLHERHVHLVSTLSFGGESDPQRQATLRKDVSPLVLAHEMGPQVAASPSGADDQAASP